MSKAEGGGSSLDDGKNNSRAADAPFNDAFSTDDDDDRYDCRHVYQNMEFENAETGETAGYRCGSWDCYCCAHNMRMNLIEELDRLVEERPEMRRLLTLTIDSEVPDTPTEAEAQHEYITQRFNALRTELNDEYGDLSYVWIRHEGDENGRPHLHLLVDRYLPQSELSAMSRRVGLGEVVDIRRVNARNAAKYLTSYLGKGTLANLPKGLRRYGSSADIELAVRGGGGDDDSDWRLRIDDYLKYSRDRGVYLDLENPDRREVYGGDFYIQKSKWGGPVPNPPSS